MIFSTINSIICYNLDKLQISSEIKGHDYSNFRHFFDKLYKRDLIISISFRNNNLKVWNIINWECIINIEKVNDNGYLYSSCIFLDNNENYIITSNYNSNLDSEPLKIYDFNGKKIKEINNSKDRTSFVDVYYDKRKSKNYIIVGNLNYIKSYDYIKNELYYKYYDQTTNTSHISITINDNNELIKLIESCLDGNIRIWNFHTGLLLDRINVGDMYLYGICLWNNDYLLVGYQDGTFKLINLKDKLIIKSICNFSEEVLTIKKIMNSHYGDLIITQSIGKDEIKIWKIKY